MLATHTIDPEELFTITAGGFSATADAFARDEETDGLWFVSMVGSQTALKAIWASLLKQPPDVAHIIKGADGMALSGRLQAVRRSPRDHRDLDDQDRPAAGLRRLARAGLHQDRRIRLREGQLPAAGAVGGGGPGAPPPFPGQAQPAPPARLLGGLALAAGLGRRGDRPPPVGGRLRLPVLPQGRQAPRRPLRRRGVGLAHPAQGGGGQRWIGC